MRAAPLIVVFLFLGACGGGEAPPPGPVESEAERGDAPAAASTLRYVGSQACRGCHVDQHHAWRDSHHAQAMMTVSSSSVAGNFDSARFDYLGAVSEFYRRDGGYFVRTDGADGELAEFAVTHTFGVEPLQQYLVSFPDGRLQALGIAADTRRGAPAEWFHLYPGEEVRAGDRLHWTGADQNWNFMCADCHSTDVRKNYDADSDRYDTRWAEISVGCEACHGPASGHVQWGAMGGRAMSDDENLGFASRGGDAGSEIETCVRCHARRGILAEGFEPGAAFLDHYRPALLDDGLYHADGQILDEVYVYGSFLQSKMYRSGVRCSDCHSGHDAGRDVSSDATCTVCHGERPRDGFPTLTGQVYAAPEHHFHEPDSPGARCVACHMPSRLYMVVDERHDHSLRIPRPDLSAELGVPNACEACHADEGHEWAAAAIARHHGDQRPPHYGEAFAAARRGEAGAEAALVTLAGDAAQSGIVRATALALLRGFASSRARSALVAGLKDADPLVRLGAVRGMNGQPPERRWLLAADALVDATLAVRLEAVALLAPAPPGTDGQRRAFAAALSEYLDVQTLNADRAETHANTANVLAQSGDPAGAREAYARALALDPEWPPALLNLADLNRAEGRDGESRVLYERALTAEPDNADVRQAYGMWLTRMGRPAEAVVAFERAAELAPDVARHAYVHGVALNSTGEGDRAVAVLAAAHERFADDADILLALATMHRDRGEWQDAQRYAERLLALRPDDPGVRRLFEDLSTRAAAPR